MMFQYLDCDPVSVAEAIEHPEWDNQFLAVHGVIFYGDGCQDGEFLLLPKTGRFDGTSISMPRSIDRAQCLLIEQDDIDSKLGGSSATGGYRYLYDSIVVGRICRTPMSEHPVRITNLCIVLMQDWEEMPKGKPYHKLRIVTFPDQRIELRRKA